MVSYITLFFALIFILGVQSQEQDFSDGGLDICDGPYVLCSTALCKPIPGNSSFATCTCDGPYTGYNIAVNVTCAQRRKEHISTFSFKNLDSMLYGVECDGDNAGPWAGCSGAHCQVPKHGHPTCECPVKVGSNVAFAHGGCPKNEAEVKKLCAPLRSTFQASSSSSSSNRTHMGDYMDDHTAEQLHSKPPKITHCPTTFS